MIVGMSAFGTSNFQSYSPPVTNMNKLTLENAIYDELNVRENTTGIDASNVKEDWQIDTILLAKFLGDLEAGNINNQGINITQFAIKRRKVSDITPITLGYKDFVNNNQFVFDDYTQSNDEFVYSIVPVGENGLEGQDNSITIQSDFTGYFLVDKDTNEVLSFDKFIGSEPNITTAFNQGRVQIDTLSQYPRFFYTGQAYHTFSLQATFVPDEGQTSSQLYQDILNKYVLTHKPFIVKSGNGSIFVVDCYNPQTDTPLNAYSDRNYFSLTLQCTEIMNYSDYMKL